VIHPTETVRVLFVCTGNSARSQMAEAILGRLGGPAFDVRSAGTHPGGVNPLTIRALSEIGIDWSGARSKSVGEYLDEPFDYRDHGLRPGARSVPGLPRWAGAAPLGFRGPGRGPGTDDERLAVFRRVRDEISAQVAPFAERAGRVAPHEAAASLRDG
jgi:arsenate reductase